MFARGLRHRAPVLWLLVPYAAGLGLGKAMAWDGAAWVWLGGAALAAGGGWAGRSRAWLGLGLAMLALLLVGIGRYVEARQRRVDWETLPARALRVELKLERRFGDTLSGPTHRLRGIGAILASNDPGQELIGQNVAFTVSLRPGQSVPPLGSRFEAVLVLQALPYAPPVDSFAGYLANQGVNFRASRGHGVRLIEPPNRLEALRQSLLAHCRQTLARGLERHPEVVAVYEGMLLGEIGGLSEEQNQLFAETGTLHLFSVSGLHIGVVALALHTVLGALRCPARWRVLLLLPLVGGYVALTGASPAALRAFGMVAYLEWGRAWRLPVNPLAALATTALVALWLEPLQLFSVSFQYSYAIVLSLLLLGQPLAEKWQEAWEPFARRPQVFWRPWHHAGRFLASHLSSALALGVSATLVGEVCTLQYFHLLTPGGLLANLVLIPASSLAIIAGMLSLFCGALGLAGVATFFNAAAGLIIHSFLRALRPWHGLDATYSRAQLAHAGVGLGLFVAILILLVIGYQRRWHPLRWWLPVPFAVVATVLVFAVKFS